ncbi:hypothetical protein [Cellulomonas xiejunii]|uniref:hypothetical protein n=1 Tax=Cellulomonas xiejunii TaxID=2968083 RepID=UPI001D0DF544|nr:hypothetical protein [Cellulomonas xiejunii]MCC2313560.1 hypothetical protein [Cellulomonas xiejunii]
MTTVSGKMPVKGMRKALIDRTWVDKPVGQKYDGSAAVNLPCTSADALVCCIQGCGGGR